MSQPPPSSAARDDGTARSLIIGTRGSLLARAQTGWVADQIRNAHPGIEVRLEVITTKGDQQQTRPLPEIGGKGLFTAELEEALHDGRIDLAVHSAKDLPTQLAAGLAVLAWPRREDARDAWISADGAPFEQLPEGSVVGTSSLRRQAQLLRVRPDLKFIALRGNVDTRLNKIRRGDAQAAVLAMAGLIRCGLDHRATHPLDPQLMLPAPGQGVLALEGRADDARAADLLRYLNDADTAIAVNAERAILNELDAGCRAPVAVFARCEAGRLMIEARVLDPQGTRCLEARGAGDATDHDRLVADLLADLHAQGAAAVIAASRTSPTRPSED